MYYWPGMYWRRHPWWATRPGSQPLPNALPARPPRYVIPLSHRLDPPWSFGPPPPSFVRGGGGWPRHPWWLESGTRAAGTGLIGRPGWWWPSWCSPVWYRRPPRYLPR